MEYDLSRRRDATTVTRHDRCDRRRDRRRDRRTFRDDARREGRWNAGVEGGGFVDDS